MAFITSQVTLTTAGVIYSLGSNTINDAILVKALPTNTGIVYIGNDTVSTSTGFPLSASDVLIFDNIGSLATVFCIGTEDGDKVAILDTGV